MPESEAFGTVSNRLPFSEGFVAVFTKSQGDRWCRDTATSEAACPDRGDRWGPGCSQLLLAAVTGGGLGPRAGALWEGAPWQGLRDRGSVGRGSVVRGSEAGAPWSGALAGALLEGEGELSGQVCPCCRGAAGQGTPCGRLPLFPSHTGIWLLVL